MDLKTTEQAMREYMGKFENSAGFYVPYDKPSPVEVDVVISHVGPEKPKVRACKSCGENMRHDDHECAYCGQSYNKMSL